MTVTLSLIMTSPQLQYYTTTQGLRIVYYPIPSQVTYIGYMVQTGSAQDPQPYHGLAHCTEHMLFKGTHRRHALHLVNRVEAVGADLNAFTTKEDTTLHISIPSRYALRAVHLLTDIVLNSYIPAEELSKEQEVIIEEIASYLDAPSERIYDEFEELLFGGTPLAHNILASEQSVRRISSSVVRRFMDQYYRPDNMVLGIWGEIDFAKAVEMIEHLYSEPRVAAGDPFKVPKVKPTTTPERLIAKTHHYRTNQCHCIIGTHAPSLHDRERYAMTLFNNFVGGPAISSQLNLHLREELGLVYSVEASYTPYLSDGVWSVYLGTGSDTLQQAVETVHSILDRYVSSPMSAEQLAISKQQIVGQLLLANDQHDSELITMLKSYLYFGRVSSVAEVAERIQAITPEEVTETVSRYLTRAQRHTLIYK